MTLDPPGGEGRIVVHGVDWGHYEKMLQIVGNRHIHVTYGQHVTMYQLQADGAYRPYESSHSFPGLRPADVERFLELGRTMPKRPWARAIRQWVRAELIPRRNAPPPRGGDQPHE